MATRTTGRTSEQRTGRFGLFQNYIRDTVSEIRKVAWPDKQTTQNLTLLVLIMAIVLGALLGGIDALFVRLWEIIS
jgi:preprotein translocase subunit SecE